MVRESELNKKKHRDLAARLGDTARETGQYCHEGECDDIVNLVVDITQHCGCIDCALFIVPITVFFLEARLKEEQKWHSGLTGLEGRGNSSITADFLAGTIAWHWDRQTVGLFSFFLSSFFFFCSANVASWRARFVIGTSLGRLIVVPSLPLARLLGSGEGEKTGIIAPPVPGEETDRMPRSDGSEARTGGCRPETAAVAPGTAVGGSVSWPVGRSAS